MLDLAADAGLSHGKTRMVLDALIASIRGGHLRPGDRLPSIRSAAATYRLAKNTIVEAYDRLVALGLAEARHGSGFYVRDQRAEEDGRFAHVSEAVDLMWLLREHLHQHFTVRVGDGHPPSSWMAGAALAGSAPLAGEGGVGHGYNGPSGDARLRQTLSEILAARAIRADPDQILLTNGANHGFDLIIRSLLEPGDVALVDDPGYYPVFAKLKLARATIRGVRRLPDGPDLNEFERIVKTTGAKLYFAQSLAHNPTGGSMSVAVMHRLLEIATRHGVTIVDDDPFADILPDSAFRLAALGSLGPVIHVGSFSKTLSASLRVGYVVADPKLIAALRDLKMITLTNSSGYAERLVHELISNGQYRGHLKQLRSRVRRAGKVALATLDRFGLDLFAPPSGGYYLWSRIPAGIDGLRFFQQAAASGVFIAPGPVFAQDRDGSANHMRLNLAYVGDRRFQAFLKQFQ